MLKRVKSITALAVLFLGINLSAQVSGGNPIVLELKYRTTALPFGLTHETPVFMPKVGITLSGGGSRGLAQIGVLKALMENNIPIDLVVGTSMGSIVGGLFSTGYSPSEIDSIANSTNWSSILGTKGVNDRSEMFVDQKSMEDKSVLKLRIQGLTPILPNSVNDGQKLLNYLNILSFQSPVGLQTNFDSLNTPFRAVCTNLVTGEPYVVKSGLLSKALRASSSVTFVLSPVTIDSTLLVDGGLVANIPTKITRNNGAEIVIAVNSTSPLAKAEELSSPFTIADQTLSIPMRLLNEEQAKYADFMITPDIGNFSSGKFSDVDWLVHQGYVTTQVYINEIKKRIDSVFNSRITENDFVVRNIAPANEGAELAELINSYKNLGSIKSSKILRDIYRLKESGIYKTLKAEIDTTGGISKITFTGQKSDKILNIDIKGVTLFPVMSVVNIIEKLSFSPFNADTVLAAAKKILHHYRVRGYSLATFENLSFNPATGTLEIIINEGKIEDIKLNKDIKTNPTIISREFAIKKGQVFNSKDLEKTLSNLRGTNLFSNIDVSVSKEGRDFTLNFLVDEKESGIMRLGIKMDNENAPQVAIDVRDENLFGSATEMAISTYLSSRLLSFDFETKANRLFDTYFTYKFNLYYKIRDIYTYIDEPKTSDVFFSRAKNGEYREIFYGASLNIGTQIGRNASLILQGKYEYNQVQNREQNSAIPFKIPIFTLRAQANIDSENKYPFPTKGGKFLAYYETAQDFLDAKTGYANFGFEYRSHLTLIEDHTISLAARLGFADKTLPLTQQYSLGGQFSFFGMRENEYRGRQVLVTSLEYRYKLPFKFYFEPYLSLRYDLGSVWEEQETIKLQDLKHGIGATLSFDTPIGPADFSIGRTFKRASSEQENGVVISPLYFYFTIGFYY